MPDTSLRRARDEDSDRVRAILLAAYAHYEPRMGRKPAPMLADPAPLIAEGLLHVLEHEGRVMGLAVIVAADGSTHLDNVAVDPAAQGHGFGGVLLRFAEDRARAAGHAELRLYTNAKMTENLAWYLRQGFVETHRAEQDGFSRVFLTKHLA